MKGGGGEEGKRGKNLGIGVWGCRGIGEKAGGGQAAASTQNLLSGMKGMKEMGKSVIPDPAF